MNRQQKDKTISASITLALLVATILLCSWIGYKLPDPPFEDPGMTLYEGAEGLESGGEIEGFGNNNEATTDESKSSSEAVSQPPETHTTGSDKESPVSKKTKVDDQPAPTNNDNTKTDVKPDDNTQYDKVSGAFNKNKDKKTNEGSGTNTGSGKKGDPNGDPDSKGNSEGVGYSIGGGLSGRDHGIIPLPPKETNKEGKITVRIRVNSKGDVVEATPGVPTTTIADKAILEKAKKAAMKIKFKAVENGPDVVGTITFIYKAR